MGARGVAAVAEAQPIACDLNGSIESAIGNAANTHFALAHAAVTLASVIPISAPAGAHPYAVAGRYYEDDVSASRSPYATERSCHSTSGLGIEIDETRLARYRCDG